MSKKRSKAKTKRNIMDVIYYVLMLLVACVCAGPFLWLVLSSLRTNANIWDMSIDFSTLTLSNYSGVFGFMNMPRYVWNTVVLTAASIGMDVVFSSMCAYPLATMEFKGKNITMGIFVSTMIIPAAAGTIINYLTISKLGLIDTMLAVILPSGSKVFSIILLRQAYLQVPHELIDAGRIDGASEMSIWARIMLPGILPTVSTIVILDFIGSWNSFLWPLIVLQTPDKYPLATALKYLNGSFNYKFGYMAAGCVFSMLPTIVIFIIFQKHYIEAVAGAVKG